MTCNGTHQIQFYIHSDKPFGKTYGRWTVDWWRWAYSMPKSSCPILDKTGENASINQPEKNVWFLAGIFASEDRTLQIHRNVNIPSDRAILFPVINCESNTIEDTELKTDKDLVDHVTKDENTIIKKL